jgi:hypothetical protein
MAIQRILQLLDEIKSACFSLQEKEKFTFCKVIHSLREGKKFKREFWMEGCYIHCPTDTDFILFHGPISITLYKIILEDVDALDWIEVK